ncbi:MAG: quinonprotein alcohol dehydrogenase [Gammaproteobacteria bacterium]|nr:MAG: quinonprotein alcohol dehydrogenase [Gammaproteobacteria bacterium]
MLLNRGLGSRTVTLLAILTGATGWAGHAAAQGIIPSPAFTAEQLHALPTDGWVTNGGNLYNQRYSPLAAINRDNIKQVKAVWRTHLNGSGMGPQNSGQGQMLYYAGTLYAVTGADDVFAVEVGTGKILWSHEAKLNPDNVLVCCGWVSRGLGMGDGRIYLGRLDGKLEALDQRTGAVVWSIQAEDPHQGFSITAAPLYYEGKVIIGFAGGDMGIRGRLKAYDAKTGALLWTFHTIPGPGEFGHDTWPQDNDAWKYGGASIWQTPAIDTELGLIYFSTGNPAPDFNGATRAGDNLFTSSMMALDVNTGNYRWHFQQVHHDIWDYDAPSPVVLFDARYKGKVRKAIAEIPKTGWVYILDRETGKPLLPIEERPVLQEPRQKTSATQPYVIGDAVVPQEIDIAPEGVDLVNGGRIFTPFWDVPTIYKPQMAVNWPPTSYDPQTNRLFICAMDHVGNSASDQKEEFEMPGFQGMWLGAGAAAQHGIARRGVFAAMEMNTNRLIWRRQWSDSCVSGSINTGGGLVFTGRNDGRLIALDKNDGRLLWEFRTDAGVNAPVTTFEYEGEQYIAAFSAGTMFFSTGAKGDSVWLFSLNGTMEQLPPPAPTGALPPPPRSKTETAAEAVARKKPEASPASLTADTARGSEIYFSTCMPCHGDAGQGGPGGGMPFTDALTVDSIAAILRTGRNNMPEFGSVYTVEDIDSIAHFVVEKLIRK